MESLLGSEDGCEVGGGDEMKFYCGDVEELCCGKV